MGASPEEDRPRRAERGRVTPKSQRGIAFVLVAILTRSSPVDLGRSSRDRGAMRTPLPLLAAVCLLGTPAFATPGPDSVAVLANAQDPGSVWLAAIYENYRFVPPAQRCTVDVPPFADLPLADFRAKVAKALVDCLEASGALDRIEAVVVMRGMPRRVRLDGVPGSPVVSLTSALAVARSTLPDGVTPLVGEDPGTPATCDETPCVSARWSNPYTKGPFDTGFEKQNAFAHHRLWLVTALDGYTQWDAAKLVTQSRGADTPEPNGLFLLMKGGDPARSALDFQYPQVAKSLANLGADVQIVPFDANLTGQKVLGFVTGTKAIGQTIEGNIWIPGAISDNLTSVGALPHNFDLPGTSSATEAQVSIARFVAAGATGAHGCVDEPLSNAFPSRQFLVDYRSGATLAEAYGRNLPFVYWKNLVLGDPMVAPFAKRPIIKVFLDGVPLDAGDEERPMTAGAHTIRLEPDGDGDAIARLRVFVDARPMMELPGDAMEFSVDVGLDAPAYVVAVAQAAAGDSGAGLWRSKGWRGFRLLGVPPSAPVGPVEPDAGGGDGLGSDGAEIVASDGGGPGGCESRPRRGGPSPGPCGSLAVVLASALLAARRGHFGA